MLLAERAERRLPRSGTRTKHTAKAAPEPTPGSQPTTRRRLLERLGAGTAGAAAAALAGRAVPVEASFDGTKVGESTSQVGIYAARNTDARPAVGVVNTFGVLGTLLP